MLIILKSTTILCSLLGISSQNTIFLEIEYLLKINIHVFGKLAQKKMSNFEKSVNTLFPWQLNIEDRNRSVIWY